MVKYGCLNGELDQSKYGSPMTAVGVYIAVVNLVCLLSMAFDLWCGFRGRKFWIPCKLFSLNSVTVTILSVATKLTVDLNSPMPRPVEQLSKLCGTVLLCNSMGFFLPSIATMRKSECVANLIALSIIVIIVTVNVCIQLFTGVIFTFIPEHVTILFFMFILLLTLWSSTAGLFYLNQLYYASKRGFIKDLTSKCSTDAVREKMVETHVESNIQNPLISSCENPNSFTAALFCWLATLALFEAIIRSFSDIGLRFCNGASDYGWSMWSVVITQILTIIISVFTIVFRCIIVVSHMSIHRFGSLKNVFEVDDCWLFVLNMWKYKPLPFDLPNESFMNFIKKSKNLILRVLVQIQIGVIRMGHFVQFLCLMLRKSFAFVHNKFRCIDHGEMRSNTIKKIFGLGYFRRDRGLCMWVEGIVRDDINRLIELNRKDSPAHLINLLSDESLEIYSLLSNIQDIGSNCNNEDREKYDVSSFSLLVLTRIATISLPFDDTISLTQVLNEAIEIIFFVDKKCKRDCMMANSMWAAWDNPNHWIQKKIIAPALAKIANCAYESEILKVLAIIEEVNKISSSLHLRYSASVELYIISESIVRSKYSTITELSACIKRTFQDMVTVLLTDLPRAILIDYFECPIEESGHRMRKVIKFFYTLEPLGGKFQWSWPSLPNITILSEPLPRYTPVVTSDDNSSKSSDVVIKKRRLNPDVASESEDIIEVQAENSRKKRIFYPFKSMFVTKRRNYKNRKLATRTRSRLANDSSFKESVAIDMEADTPVVTSDDNSSM